MKTRFPFFLLLVSTLCVRLPAADDRLDQALDIQLRLERAFDADNDPDPYVFEELEAIYKAQGNAERATHYAARLKATEHKK